MYKDFITSLPDIGIYPTISLVIFFLFFIGLYGWVTSIKKEEANQMAHLPLEDATTSTGESHD